MKKILSYLIVLVIFNSNAIAQTSKDSVNTALLIIDIQEFYFPSKTSVGLYNADTASRVAQAVLTTVRDTKQLVIHVQHQSTSGMDIHANVAPINGEKIITKTEINSFNGTDLLAYLTEFEIERLIIIGMQTHMCLEAATRAAYDFGFDCVVIGDACATRDVQYGETLVKASDVHASTLATLQSGGYCQVINYNYFSKNIGTYLFEEITD